jgi:hypothetical protein
MSANQLAARVETRQAEAAGPSLSSRSCNRRLPRHCRAGAQKPHSGRNQWPRQSHRQTTSPTGWQLTKDSWHFHRRFYAIFRRPMRHGEYSQLLWQIRRGTAEHLWEDCWHVRLPGGGDKTLPVRATRWRLITILLKHWQPPTSVEQGNPSRGNGEAAVSSV